MWFHPMVWVAFVVLGGCVAGHGQDRLAKELAERVDYSTTNTMNLRHCCMHIMADGLLEQATTRRGMLARNLMDQRGGLGGRNLPQLLNTSHRSRHHGFGLNTSAEKLFKADQFHSCVLAPETTEGPFYLEGEFVRRTLWEDQGGVPLYLDLQILDMATCKPVPEGVFVEIWSANATGVYGSSNETFLRGLQPTDRHGSVSFHTVFPGHYPGRTNHVHVMTHVHATRFRHNNTVYDNTATHCGQIFFDQALIHRVERLAPYASNTVPPTLNADDVFLAQQAAEGSDPFVEYVWLERYGVLGWIILGVNMSNVREISVSGFHM